MKFIQQLLLSILSILMVNLSYAQNFDAREYTKIIPPSPNASELGKYGEVPINESTGALNLSIPLLNIGTKNLSLPITLSYLSNGLRVNAISSRAGFDWVLNAEGIITRTVYDQPDIDTQRGPKPDFSKKDDALMTYLRFNNVYDKEPDVFNYNFSGVTGKFIIDDNGLPQTLPHTNLRIQYQYQGGELIFTITKPDGVKYYFGGVNATEYIIPFESMATPVASSWYLIKIEHPNGDFIAFNYEKVYSEYVSGISQILTINPTGSTGSNLCGECPVSPSSVTQSGYFQSNGMRIKEIVPFGFGKVIFDYKSRQDISGTDGLISSITLVGINNERLKKIVFDHQNVLSIFLGDGSDNGRPYLMKISELGETDAKSKIHQFFYKDIDQLPPRLSFSQDYDGYYNGKVNQSLVQLSSYQEKNLFNNVGGDRSPDGNYSVKGTLSKVLYPSGGYDEIYYEPNDAYVTELSPDIVETVSLDCSGNYDSYYSYEHIIKSKTFTCNKYQAVNISSEFINQNELIDEDTHIRMEVHLIDKTTNEEIANWFLGQNESRTLRNIFLFPGRSYSLTIDLFGYDGMIGNVFFKYVPEASQLITHNKEMPGLRIQKIVTKDYNGVLSNVKKYNYRYSNEPSKSSGVVIKPVKSNVSIINKKFYCHPDPHKPLEVFSYNCDYTEAYSSSNLALDYFGNSSVAYESVLVSFGENYQNGGKEYIFEAYPRFGGNVVFGNNIPEAPVINQAYNIGILLKENTFKMQGSSFVYLEKKQNFYNDSLINKTDGYYIRKRYSYGGLGYSPPDPEEFDAYDVILNDIRCYWKYLVRTETTNFDNQGNHPVVSSIQFLYNPIHCQIVKSINKGNSKEVITNYKYSHDLISVGGNEQARQKLIQDWNISALWEKQVLSNRSSFNIQTEYLVNLSGNRVLPNLIKTNTNTTTEDPMENRLYFSYDDDANLLGTTIHKGPSVSYLWDYSNQLLIAEVKNALQADISYTSFEADGKGNWSFTGTPSDDLTAPTGSKVYNIANGAISKSGLTSTAEYVVSYWTKNSSAFVITGTQGTAVKIKSFNGWNLYEHTIKGVVSVSISGTGLIDELRLYPSDAQMTTYTYEPLVGMTSSTDTKGQTSYYEYDDFQRLKWIKDQYGNILKTMDYHYQNQ